MYTRLHLSLYSDRKKSCSTEVCQHSTVKYICQEVMSSTCVNMYVAPVSAGVSQYSILHLSVQESGSSAVYGVYAVYLVYAGYAVYVAYAGYAVYAVYAYAVQEYVRTGQMPYMLYMQYAVYAV